jgi:hypothetical protein
MNVGAPSTANALIPLGLQARQPPVNPAAATPAPTAVTAGSDADGDNDGSRVGTQLDVKA